MRSNAVVLSWPGFESALEAEYLSLGIEGISAHEGVFSLRGETPKLAWARQTFPDPIAFDSLSIKQTAEEISSILPQEGSWKIHFHSLSQNLRLPPGELTGREELVTDALKELLRKKDRYALKRWVNGFEQAEILILCLLLPAGGGFLSVTNAQQFAPYGPVIAAGYGGRIVIEEEKRPPARAYRKLIEALAVSNLEIQEGSQVVDLGSAPGSWSWVCLKKGAKVIAVDRSELAPELMKHRDLRFVAGDAFKFAPQRQLDWLISDVVSTPERTLELLERWIENRWMKNFCITIKFKGEPTMEPLNDLRKLLKGVGSSLVRHLENNKNEVTVIGSI